MPSRTDLFYNNRLYKLLSNTKSYSEEFLQQLNLLLHEEPELVDYNHPMEGSFFHLICQNADCQDNIAFRMVYALSNAGADPNVTDGKGNTPLHEAIIRGLSNCGFDFIQALFRVGVDPRLVNHDGKTADAYLENNPQLVALYKSYSEGIWSAIESNNIQETERFIKGFIKVDCKHNSNKTLLDKARDNNCTPIIDILAEHQVTNEFLHSILAYDWDRASIIYKYEYKFLKINSFDTIHRLTCIRTYSKSLLEYCLDTHSSKPFEILYSCSEININVNILCTDGLPFFFHCFDNDIIPCNIRKNILFNSNMFMKSYKGETILFYLVDLYVKTDDKEYLTIFKNILINHPLLLTQRNPCEQTIIEYIELTTTESLHKKLKPFYEIIMNILIIQLKKDSIIKKYILNHFGYYLLIFYKNKKLEMTIKSYQYLCSLKSNQGLIVSIKDMFQAIIQDDFNNLKNIFKIQSNVYHAKDSFGRTCAHLTVLHQRYIMLKYICDEYPNIINAKDNFNRTPLHYACIMNDVTSIETLKQVHAQQIADCFNFLPNDYLVNRDLCSSKEYFAQDFCKNECERKSSSISNYLKIAFYPNLKKAIEHNSVDEIKSINNEITTMGFHLKDLNPNSYLNDYVQGQRYIPLLFVALEHRSLASIQCLIELGLPLAGQMFISKSTLDENSRLISFRSRAEELEYFDIIDIINSLEDDVELKNVFQQNSQSNENTTRIELPNDLDTEQITKKQNLMTRPFNKPITKSQTCVLH